MRMEQKIESVVYVRLLNRLNYFLLLTFSLGVSGLQSLYSTVHGNGLGS